MIPQQPSLTWAIVLTLFHLAAIGSTIFRLYRRYTIHRVWWDDFLVVLALTVDLVYFAMLWARYSLNTLNHSVQTRIILYWISSLSFFIVVWTSRISLALSLSRLLQARQRKMRLMTNAVACIFALIALGLILQLVIVCGTDSSWHQSVNVQCSGTSWVSSLTADVIADITLISVPLAFLWGIRLPRRQRKMVLSVFSASLLTCAASITVHTFLLGSSNWGPGAGKLVSYTSHIEATISLCVANLLVMVAYFYQVASRNACPESDEYDELTLVPTYTASTFHKYEMK